MDRYKDAVLHLYVQQDQALFDVEAMENWRLQHPEAHVYTVSALNDTRRAADKTAGERYIHAKLVSFVTPTGAFLLIGSPNFTHAALAAPAARGNIETAILTYYPVVADFQRLLSAAFLQISEVESWADLRPTPTQQWVGVIPRSSLRLIHANYAECRLTLELAYSGGELSDLVDIQVICQILDEKPDVPINAGWAASGRLTAVCELRPLATLAWVLARGKASAQWVVSDRRWVVFPQDREPVESGFGSDEFDRCVEIGGLERIKEALRLAMADDEPDWLLAFLQQWDLGKILEPGADQGSDLVPRGLVGRGPQSPLITKQEILFRSLSALTHPRLEEVLQEQLASYRQRMIDGLSQSEPADIWVGLQYATVFNLLCLLLMVGFGKRIGAEHEKKKRGLAYPLMTYGHMREMTRQFVEFYPIDWENHLRAVFLAIARLPERNAVQAAQFMLYHCGQMAAAYTLAARHASQLDLETPAVLKPRSRAWSALPAASAKSHARVRLSLPDGQADLSMVLAHYEIAMEATGLALQAVDLRHDLELALKGQ